MQVNSIKGFIAIAFVTISLVRFSSAQTIVKNQTGIQGDYHYEYWKDNGNGTMTLGEGGNFSCSWDTVDNILFRKGMRPGSRSQIITYSAVYNPSGNSYLGAYGWTKDPLVEYYIVDSWGTWKPPGTTSKGTFVSDGGVYEIYEKVPEVRLAIYIEGGPVRQFWSVRQTKRTSGTITCANHFDAWAARNMVMGDMYELSFLVEGYQGSGKADVSMSMTTGSTAISGNLHIDKSKAARSGIFGTPVQTVIADSRQALTFYLPQNSYISPKVYNIMGREIAGLPAKEYSTGRHHVMANLNASGKYIIH